MSNCQNVNFIPIDTCLFSLEFPTLFYGRERAISVTKIAQLLFLSCLHHRHNYKENGHCTYVSSWKEYLWIFFITATLPAKKQQHVIHNFSAASQECLTLKMEATRSFEASGTAPNPTRPEPSARNSNTTDRTWNQTTVRPAEWTEQFLCRCCPTNQVSAVQSQYKCVNGCSVVNVLMVDMFLFQNSKFLLITAFCLIFLKALANCGPSHYTNPPVWLVFRRHNTEICEFLYKRREKIFILFFEKI